MPIYEYQCGSCRHTFDLRQGFDAEPVATCPRCNASASRQFYAPAVIYKGSGFYTTDYKRKEESTKGSSTKSHSHSHSDSSDSKATSTTSHED